jgi:hypothetical protein
MSVRKNQKTCSGRSFAQFENAELSVKEKQTVKGGNTNYSGSNEIIIAQ